MVLKLKTSNILTDTMNQETVSVSTCDFHTNKNLTIQHFMVFKNLNLCKINVLLFVVQKINCVHLITLVFPFPTFCVLQYIGNEGERLEG